MLRSVVHSGSSGSQFQNDRGADSCGYTRWEQSWEINNQNSAPCFFWLRGTCRDIGHPLFVGNTEVMIVCYDHLLWRNGQK